MTANLLKLLVENVLVRHDVGVRVVVMSLLDNRIDLDVKPATANLLKLLVENVLVVPHLLFLRW